MDFLFAVLCVVIVAILMGSGILPAFIRGVCKELNIGPQTEDPAYKYCPRFQLEGVFEGRTLLGAHVEYHLKFHIEVTDREAYRKAQMLEENNQRDWLYQYNSRVVRPLLQSGNFFFVHDWYYTPIGKGYDNIQPNKPAVHLYEYVMVDGKAVVEKDLNRSNFSKALLEQEYEPWNGCKAMWPISVEVGVWDEKIIQENYKMLHPDDVAAIKRDNEYMVVREIASIVARYEGHNKTQLGLGMEIRSRFEEGAGVRIEWKRTQFRDKRVLGFRRDKEFDDTNLGRWIVDSTAESDVLIDPVEPGQTYCYTFRFQGTKDEEEHFLINRVCFSVAVPKPESAASPALEKDKPESLFEKRVRSAREHLNMVSAQKEFAGHVHENLEKRKLEIKARKLDPNLENEMLQDAEDFYRNLGNQIDKILLGRQ